MRKEFPLISIVVPMHNSAEFISRCIESIIQQDYQNYELILVDDHSTDHTLQICEKYKDDYRIKVVQNGGKCGASATRNLGIKKSKGVYIAFVDSDDIISPYYLSALYILAEAYPNRLAVCGYIEFKELGDIFKGSTDSNVETLSSEIIISNIFHFHSSAWGCLFRTDLIFKYSIYMEENASFNEDVFFTCKYLSICDGAAVTNEKLYGYYVNPNGIGAHKAHSDLNIDDVNHRAEGYIALLNAVDFTQKNAPNMTKYMCIGYIFIAAEVLLTAARAGVEHFDYDKEIKKFLSIKNRLKFCIHGKNIKQILLINGVAISPKFSKIILDDLKLLDVV